jgi:putative membrane protein
MMIYDHDVSAWGWIWMSVSMLAFWGLLIGAVVLVMRSLAHARPTVPIPGSPTASAEQMLAERFARGDIDSDEYRQRLQTLRTGTP